MANIIVAEGNNELNVQMISLEPVGWISPTGHIDASEEWTWPHRAYDGNLNIGTMVLIDPKTWSPYLELLVNEAFINKIRFYTALEAYPSGLIDIDVYYNGGWVDVYSGFFTGGVWVEKSILAGTQLVSQARVRFYNTVEADQWKVLREFQFNKIA